MRGGWGGFVWWNFIVQGKDDMPQPRAGRGTVLRVKKKGEGIDPRKKLRKKSVLSQGINGGAGRDRS